MVSSHLGQGAFLDATVATIAPAAGEGAGHPQRDHAFLFAKGLAGQKLITVNQKLPKIMQTWKRQKSQH